eukprot:1302125-Amorphochlora_amoeboformis.AAC.1
MGQVGRWAVAMGYRVEFITLRSSETGVFHNAGDPVEHIEVFSAPGGRAPLDLDMKHEQVYTCTNDFQRLPEQFHCRFTLPFAFPPFYIAVGVERGISGLLIWVCVAGMGPKPA